MEDYCVGLEGDKNLSDEWLRQINTWWNFSGKLKDEFWKIVSLEALLKHESDEFLSPE